MTPATAANSRGALQVIAEAQKTGGMAAFIDVEHAHDPVYAKALGVDVDNLLVSQPDFAEQALEITGALIASGSIDVLVVDSVAALVPKAELDGEVGDSHMGVQARLMSQAMRQTDRCRLQVKYLSHLHQPDPRKNRCDVRKPGDHHRRPGLEVLFIGAN
jgi:protein RecA